jgi:hypothetical protein
VAERDGIVNGPTVLGGPLVEIAAADADRANFEEDVIGADLGPDDVAELDGTGLGSVVDDGLHWWRLAIRN